jgi:alpha-ribazole phosphatase
MRVLLVPHAATDWNALGRYQGHSDQPLSATGRQQAARLAERFAEEPLHTIFASDLRRAAETADTIAGGHRLPVQFDLRLREMHFGAWEGRTYAEVQETDGERLRAWETDVLRTAPPGGETLTQLAERVNAFYSRLAAEAIGDGEEHTALVVAHRGSLQVLLCLALGLPPQSRWQLRLEPASLSKLSLHPQGAVLVCLNDTHHLGEVAHAG